MGISLGALYSTQVDKEFHNLIIRLTEESIVTSAVGSYLDGKQLAVIFTLVQDRLTLILEPFLKQVIIFARLNSKY